MLYELAREYRGVRRLSLHAKLVVSSTAFLLVVGTLFVTANEWGNEATLGSLDLRGKLMNGFAQAVMPRTAGFNTVDIGAMRESSWLVLDVLMFIGGGPAGTAGGIKVTTFAVLVFVVWSEARGNPHVHVFDRGIGHRTQAQALTVVLLGITCIVAGTGSILELTDLSTDEVFFEVVSAFGTVGLSTGITADLPGAAQLVIIALMFLGRVGPVTLVAALALRENRGSTGSPAAPLALPRSTKASTKASHMLSLNLCSIASSPSGVIASPKQWNRWTFPRTGLIHTLAFPSRRCTWSRLTHSHPHGWFSAPKTRCRAGREDRTGKVIRSLTWAQDGSTGNLTGSGSTG